MKKGEFLGNQLLSKFFKEPKYTSIVQILRSLSNEQFDEIMSKYNSKTNIIENLVSMGNKRFLLGQSLFCFGDRQSTKTTNMIIKSLLKFFENPRDKFTIICVSSTFESGRGMLDIVRKIAEQFKWEITQDKKYDIVLKIDGFFVWFIIRTTADSIRGIQSDFLIVDHANFITNRHLYQSLLISDKSFVIGGNSFYE
ncbi:MAG: hypothetical protein KGH87_08375 [Thaumarchaeota archaeon]|nr:hypothetical protein [Nitrososphaerota archaeon]